MGVPEELDTDTHPNTHLRRVEWSRDLQTVRRILRDYREWLADHAAKGDAQAPAALRRIDEEVAGLPGVYGPPEGDIILAFEGEALAACGSLRALEPKVGEIKRVYVRADHRGPGFGPRLTQAVLDRARELGYERVRVDASPTMYAAIQFYQAMGFKPIPAYRPHPVQGALFFEYDFASQRGARPSHRPSKAKRPAK